AAKGIAAAVEQVATGRHGAADAAPKSTLKHGLDVFHTAREAHRVLARHWCHAEAAWDEAEAAAGRVARARQQGVDARGPAGPALSSRPSHGASGARRWPGVGGCGTAVRRRRTR